MTKEEVWMRFLGELLVEYRTNGKFVLEGDVDWLAHIADGLTYQWAKRFEPRVEGKKDAGSGM